MQRRLLMIGDTMELTRNGAKVSPTNPLPVIAAGAPTITPATGAGAIALTYTDATNPFWFDTATIKLSAAPALAGSLTITHDSVSGAAYDVVIASLDPSTLAATDIVVAPAGGALLCAAGDAITIAYANPSAVTYGATIRARSI